MVVNEDLTPYLSLLRYNATGLVLASDIGSGDLERHRHDRARSLAEATPIPFRAAIKCVIPRPVGWQAHDLPLSDTCPVLLK